MMNQDTICAIATAQGGAIGSIRVSGPEAISITSLIFKPAKPDKLFSDQKPYSLTFGRIYDGDEIIDEVLVSLFRTPHSYTGEDSTEITCHGSSYILQQVLQLLIKKGCRMAQPGEYTQRAFLNGKMDLSQAEAVADLIASSSAATHRLAMSQMRGGFSKELTDLRNKLLNFTSMIELELDFSEEDVEFADRSALKKLADEIEQVISRLVQSFNVGNAIKSGVPVAIIGETNAGKSTLLNVLLNEDKAIVSDIHGTTRDVIEDTISIGGVTFRFIDTAGIRDTEDVVEKIGVERAKKYLNNADLVIYVVDTSTALDENDHEIMELLKDRHAIVLLNKSDLSPVTTVEDIRKHLDKKMISISAKEQTGMDDLEETIKEMFFSGEVTFNDEVYITNIRHKTSLQEALRSLHLVLQSIADDMPEDFYSIDLMNAYEELGNIIGESVEDDLVNEIFSKFCMGK